MTGSGKIHALKRHGFGSKPRHDWISVAGHEFSSKARHDRISFTGHNFSFVTGHDFSRAAQAANRCGLQPPRDGSLDPASS